MRPGSLALLLTCLTPLSAAAEGLSPAERRLVDAVDRRLPATLALVRETVDIPSATENVAGVRRVGEVYARELKALGFRVRWAEMPPEMKRAGHLVAERTGTRGKRLLLIGHLDTVLDGERYVERGGEATGTGTLDMKGGNAVVLAALQALHDAALLEGTRIAVVFTGDEEDPGAPVATSRRDLVEIARRSDAALAFEAAVGDTATVARRGVTTWMLEVTAPTGHSSGIFGERAGSGAVFEAARILHRMYEELRSEKDLTFNPGVIVGGTDVEFVAPEHRGSARGKTNVIAQKVIVEGDLRALTPAQRQRVGRRMEEIAAASLPRAEARFTFHDEYPPMAPSAGNDALLAVLDEASRDLGYGPVPALEPGRRGAGDISFVAPFVSGLDGLGAQGRGSHAPGEAMDLASFPRLVKRTALLIHRLTR